MNFNRLSAAAGASIIFCSLPASAVLVAADHPNFGQGSLTLDEAQGLYWLTPKITIGRSFLETQALLATDPRFSRFRVATLEELHSLYATAAIPDVNVAGYGALYGTEANVPGIQYLQGFVGVTYSVVIDGLELAETSGFVGSSFISLANGFLSVDIGNAVIRRNVKTTDSLTSFGEAYTTWGSIPVGTNLAGVGTWLVSAVPEPPAPLAMLAGLTAICIWLRKSNRKQDTC